MKTLKFRPQEESKREVMISMIRDTQEIEAMRTPENVRAAFETRGVEVTTKYHDKPLASEGLQGGMYMVGNSIVELTVEDEDTIHVHTWVEDVRDKERMQKYVNFTQGPGKWLDHQLILEVYTTGERYESWMRNFDKQTIINHSKEAEVSGTMSMIVIKVWDVLKKVA